MENSFKDFFSAQATLYSKYRPHYPTALFQYVASLPEARHLAWDCGTGNGQAAVGLAQFFDRVIATDPSEEQIKHAVPHAKIKYSVGLAEEAKAVPSNALDLVTAAAAAHWFDFDKFYVQVN